MGKKMEARAAKFVQAVAEKLARQSTSADVISLLEPLLEQAVADLPSGKLQSALASDLSRFASLLHQKVVEIRPELRASSKEPIADIKDASLSRLLEVSQGPVLTNEAFSSAMEAIVIGAVNGAGSSDQLKEWIASCRRMLGSRTNAPLPLWWAYAALELHSFPEFDGSGEQRAVHVVSSAKALMDRLKSLTAGRCDSFTCVAALAPVVSALYEASCLLGEVSDTQTKSWRKAVKSLVTSCKEVTACIAIYNSRKQDQTGYCSKKLGASSLDFRGLVLAGKGLNRVTGSDKSGRKGISKLLPLSSAEMKKSLILEVDDIKLCASVVSGEVFLLGLMLSILERRGKRKGDLKLENPEFCDELRFLALRGGDLFLDLLLDTKLPVEPVLDGDEELFLRGILYDVVLIDSPQSQSIISVFMKKVAIARRAIQYYRSNGMRTKAVELSSRLSSWEIPTGFTGWLQSLKGKEKLSDRILKDSRALLGWLIDTADEAVTASILAKATTSNANDQKLGAQVEEFDTSFYVDTKGDSLALEAADKAFADACKSMKGSLENETNGAVSVEDDEGTDDESDADGRGDDNAPSQFETSLSDNLRDEVEAVLADKPSTHVELDAAAVTAISPTRGIFEVVLCGTPVSASTLLEPVQASIDEVETKDIETDEQSLIPVSETAAVEEDMIPVPETAVEEEAKDDDGQHIVPAPVLEAKHTEQPKDTTIQIITGDRMDEPKKDMETDEQPSTPVPEHTKDTTTQDMVVESTVKQRKTGGRKKQLKEPETPAPSFSAPSARCTRSGRKYGDLDAPLTTTRKRRKIQEEAAAAAAGIP